VKQKAKHFETGATPNSAAPAAWDPAGRRGVRLLELATGGNRGGGETKLKELFKEEGTVQRRAGVSC